MMPEEEEEAVENEVRRKHGYATSVDKSYGGLTITTNMEDA
jgi:hypothetical protein